VGVGGGVGVNVVPCLSCFMVVDWTQPVGSSGVGGEVSGV